MAYLAVSSGAVISVRYCLMTKEQGKALKACCKKAGKMACCKTDQKLVKLHDSHQQADTDAFAFAQLFTPAPLPFFYTFTVPALFGGELYRQGDSSPPGRERQTIYLLNRRLLI